LSDLAADESCDQLVLTQGNIPPEQYSDTLLRLVAGEPSRPILQFLSRKENMTMKRIKKIVSLDSLPTLPSRAWLASVCLTALLGCITLAFCQEGKQSAVTNQDGEYTLNGTKGTVTMDGKPVAGATVTLMPSADGGFISPQGLTHLVVCGPAGDFNPQTYQTYHDLCDTPIRATGANKMFSKMQMVNGKNQMWTLTNDPENVRKAIESLPQLQYIRTERLTKESFEEHIKPWAHLIGHQPPSADGGFVTGGGPGVSGFTHLVFFSPKGDFNPRDPMSFLSVFRSKILADGPQTGYFRTKPVDGKLLGSLCTGNPEKLEQFIKSVPELEFVCTERLTKESFEAYEKTAQLSLPPADGGYASPDGGFTHLIVYGASDGFVPVKPMDYMNILNPRLGEFGVHAGYFRSKPEEGKLIAYNLTTTPDAYKKLVDAIPQFKYIRTERLTKEMFEAYEKTAQLSLPFGGFTHIVYFGGKGDFEPKSKTALCRRVGIVLKAANVVCGVQRSRVEEGKLIGAILTNDPKACQKAIDANDELRFIRDEQLTEQLFNVYRVYRGEDFLPAADGGFQYLGHQYIVTFKVKGDFAPTTVAELFAHIYKSSTFCAQFKMRKDGEQIFGTFITDDPDELKIVIAEDPKLEYVGAERLTAKSFETYKRLPQE
jgi:hypothetical protein